MMYGLIAAIPMAAIEFEDKDDLLSHMEILCDDEDDHILDILEELPVDEKILTRDRDYLITAGDDGECRLYKKQ